MEESWHWLEDLTLLMCFSQPVGWETDPSTQWTTSTDFYGASPDFREEVNNTHWCPPTSFSWSTRGCRENRRNNLLILNQDMGALDKEKKRHPISKIPLSGPSCEESPHPPSSPPVPTLPLSFPLLFFSFLIKPSGVVRSFETRTPSHVKS